ncbi:MAG: GAF domain-containing protein, partial [Phormidesmis sp.]
MTANNASLDSFNHTDVKHSDLSGANATENGRTENGSAENGRAENSKLQSTSWEGASTDLTISPDDLLAEQGRHRQDNQSDEISMLESAVVPASVSLDLLLDLPDASNGFSTALPKSSGQRAFGIANRMAKATTLENLYQITVTELRKRFKCDRAFIYQFQSLPAGRVIAESMTAGYTPTLGESLSAIAFGASRPQDYQTQRAIAMSDASEEAVSPHQMQLLQRFQVQASLSLPIFVQEHLWGLLVVQQCDAARPWQETDIGLLYQVSTELTLRLQSYQIQQQSQKEIDRGETLSSVIKNIRGFSDIQQIFEATTQDLRVFLKADRVAVFQFTPGSNHETGEVVIESVGVGIAAAKEITVEDHCFGGKMAEEYRTGRIWAADDVYNLGLADCYLNVLSKFQVRANLVVPLRKENQLWGLFCIHQCSGPRHWQAVEIAFVQRVAAQLDLAMQQADYLNQLKEKTAQLTEVADREKASKELLQQQVIDLLSAVGPALQGDLTVRASVSDTEVGTVASAYNTTLQSLQKIVLQVQEAANQVGETFQLSETSATSVSQQAQQQAEALAQALTRVQKMASSTEAVAQDAQQVEAATQQTNQIVQQGDRAMNLTVDGIMAIRSTVAETNQRIKRLSESSQKVSKIVSLISHFTTQTQLLALNASIEATRAGQFGRGFAVVADEVRSLARQSAEAATEIEQFVQEIQMGTAEVSTAMETGIQQVAEGTERVTAARQNLTAIVEATDQISQLIAEITQTTHSQADEFKLVTQTITEATEIAKQTSED